MSNFCPSYSRPNLIRLIRKLWSTFSSNVILFFHSFNVLNYERSFPVQSIFAFNKYIGLSFIAVIVKLISKCNDFSVCDFPSPCTSVTNLLNSMYFGVRYQATTGYLLYKTNVLLSQKALSLNLSTKLTTIIIYQIA